MVFLYLSGVISHSWSSLSSYCESVGSLNHFCYFELHFFALLKSIYDLRPPVGQMRANSSYDQARSSQVMMSLSKTLAHCNSPLASSNLSYSNFQRAALQYPSKLHYQFLNSAIISNYLAYSFKLLSFVVFSHMKVCRVVFIEACFLSQCQGLLRTGRRFRDRHLGLLFGTARRCFQLRRVARIGSSRKGRSLRSKCRFFRHMVSLSTPPDLHSMAFQSMF